MAALPTFFFFFFFFMLFIFSLGKTDVNPLPNDPKDIERHFFVRHHEPYSSVYIEDRLHSEMSLPRRLRLIRAIPPTLRHGISQELNFVPEDLEACEVTITPETSGTGNTHQSGSLIVHNEKLAQQHIILAHVKAIYCLPRHKRPRIMIRSILESFPSDQVHETCEMAKEWRILSSIKKASYRIPGQKVGGSERFGVMLNGAYPRRFTVAATSADETYAKSTAWAFRIDTGPAEIMVFLNDVAMGSLQLSMAPPDETDKTPAFEEPYGQGAILHFDVNVKNTRASSIIMPLPATSRIHTFSQTDDDLGKKHTHSHDQRSIDFQDEAVEVDPWQQAVEDAKKALDKHLETLPDMNSRQLYESVFQLVAGSCTSGMIPQDIKVCLPLPLLFIRIL